MANIGSETKRLPNILKYKIQQVVILNLSIQYFVIILNIKFYTQIKKPYTSKPCFIWGLLFSKVDHFLYF